MVSAQHRRRSSRKRSLACIGVGLAAVVNPLLRTVCLVHATPFLQHRVGRSLREITYGHTLSQQTRQGPSSGFWYPDEFSGNVETPQHDIKSSPLESLAYDNEPREVVLSLIADASRQHPPGAPRLKRHNDVKTKRQVLLEAERPQWNSGPSVSNSQPNPREDTIRGHRRVQVTDKFVEDSTSAILQEEGEEGASQNLGSANNSAQNSDSDYAGYNVTAQVEYNLSEPKDETEDSEGTGGTASSVLTTSSKLPDNSSSTSKSIYQPLRIRAILAEQRNGGEFLTKKGREILLNEIIRPALLTWSAALRVEPVIGNLTVDKHQLFDNQTCGPGLDSGLPSPRVPSSHLTEGIPDTDMILYLSLGFSSDAFNETNYDRNSTSSLYEYVGSAGKGDATKIDGYQRGGEGRRRFLAWNSPAEDNEFTEPLLVRPVTSEPMICSGDYVAAASYCSTDQYDRPTAGMLHICIGHDFFNITLRNKQIVTVMHEVGHSLGFNSRSMAHFRRPDGSPITPRVNGEIVETQVECTGPRSRRRYASVPLPSEEILQFRTVRGGVRVAEVVTPSVLQVVRNHFDCQNLSGAELESGEYSPLAGDPEEQACLGDHWERRLFQNDLMNPVVDSVEYSPFLSTITLAYFADSGWYQVDLSMAQLAASWGRGAGCSFVEDTCVDKDGEVAPSNKPFFCNAVPKTSAKGLVEEIDGCTPDLSRKAACSLGQYETELPTEYQYFGGTYGGTVGGSDPFIDYCPTYTGFANGLCSSQENAALLQVNRIERFGKRNSRCLSGVVKARPTALCLPIACVVEDRTLHVKIDGTWQLCKSKEQELKLSEDEYVVCPDPRRVCPTFYCHHDCLGTSGRCDYDSGACVCSRLNSTNATIGATGEIFNNLTVGICEQNLNDMIVNQSMPHADSPLSDYYVADKEDLKNDRRWCVLKTWEGLLLIICITIVVSIVFWYFRLKCLAEESKTEQGDDSGSGSPGIATNPNKHKMIAALLVDMRVNGNAPDGASLAPTNQTAASLCGSESAASAASSRCPSYLDNDDRSSLASEDVMEDVDVLDSKAKPKYEMRKRRLKGHPNADY